MMILIGRSGGFTTFILFPDERLLRKKKIHKQRKYL